MKHEESNLQKECVRWFRMQYPQYAMLLTHPINEGGKNTRVSGAIHKGEGTVAGVADLLLFLPAIYETDDVAGCVFVPGLMIEMKAHKGKQSQAQKDFQKMAEAAGYKYIVIRSFDDFRKEVTLYISHVSPGLRVKVAAAHVEIEQATRQREKEHFYKVIGKEPPKD